MVVTVLTVEGYLLAFQKLILQSYCLFCLAIFSVVIMISLYRIFVFWRPLPLLGFLCGFIVFLSVWFINSGIRQLPVNERILIYAENCPHCHKVIEYCRENGIAIEQVNVKEIMGICRALRINRVPILVENFSENYMIIAAGEYKILKRLDTSRSKVPNVKMSDKSSKNVKEKYQMVKLIKPSKKTPDKQDFREEKRNRKVRSG